jgi:hypothetical protein
LPNLLPRPFGSHAADAVSVFDDLEAALRGHATQVVKLSFRMLIES